MLTPPTPRTSSFSQESMGNEESAKDLQNQTAAAPSPHRVTPPSTASPLKRPLDSTSSETEGLTHDGVTSFATVDPTVSDLMAPPSSSPHHVPERQPPSSPARRSASPTPKGKQNNTIVNTIRELGYRKYLQAVNPPNFLPTRLRATPVTLEPATPALRTTPQKKKAGQPQLRSPMKPTRTGPQVQSKKRKLSEIEPNSVMKVPAFKARKSEDPVGAKEVEPQPKKARTAPPTTSPAKATVTKPKSRKTPKKITGTGTSKPEKSRTKEQRWGDYLKQLVHGDKDVFQQIPEVAIPPMGSLIDETPVRPYTFNKGKVQDYGNADGLHPREQELAREVGLSYNAYRQQKRMAFVGYAAMQLEGKKEFKKSHTQSMCNIDGNKATHLWVHFHDCWGWMPENPNPPITMADLGDLQLPDLHVAQAQQEVF
jgi:hypothetical protein